MTCVGTPAASPALSMAAAVGWLSGEGWFGSPAAGAGAGGGCCAAPVLGEKEGEPDMFARCILHKRVAVWYDSMRGFLELGDASGAVAEPVLRRQGIGFYRRLMSGRRSTRAQGRI